MTLRNVVGASTLTLLLACLANSGFTQTQNRTKVQTPVEKFAQLPAYADVSLSPDGTQAVALRAIGDTYHAILLDFATGKSKILMASNPEQFLFNWCQFANPTRVVCTVRSYIVLEAGQVGISRRVYRDGRTVVTRLLAINTDGTDQLQLIKPTKSRIGGKLIWNPPSQDDIISWLADDAEHVLIQLNREDRIQPSVYRLNIYNNKIKREQKFLRTVSRWYADVKGRIRFATGYVKRDEPVAYSFESGSRERVDMTHLGGLHRPRLLTFAADDNSAFIVANHNGSNTRGLHRINLKTAQVEETLLSNEAFDIERFWSHNASQQVLYAGYDETGESLTWLNADLEKHLNSIRSQIGDPMFLNIWSSTLS